MDTVAVVGGGLAGLVAARHLASDGADVTLYERRDRVGGRVATATRDGFTLDRGFQVLFTAYPAVRRELDREQLSLRYVRPGATVARPGERHALADPLGDPGGLVGTLANPDVTWRDLLRLARLRRDLRRTDPSDLLAPSDESIADYLASLGFSESFRRAFLAPFYGGITLDRSLSTSRRVFEYTFKMLAEGRTAVPAAGMAAIPRQLADRARAAGVTVETGRAVTSLTPGDDGLAVQVGGETRSVDGAVVATEAATARSLTGVEAIPEGGNGCVTLHLSLPATQRLAVRHPLVLNAASARPNSVAIMSDVAPSYAPAGRQLLDATVLGHPSESDEELCEEVRAALSSWFPENRFDDLALVRADRIETALPPQHPGFRRAVPDPTAPAGPVVLAGDYTRWGSIQGAMESGRRAAAALAES